MSPSDLRKHASTCNSQNKDYDNDVISTKYTTQNTTLSKKKKKKQWHTHKTKTDKFGHGN